MKCWRNRNTWLTGGALAASLFATAAQASTIAYWRMEANTVSGPDLSIVNEAAGGTPLTNTNPLAPQPSAGLTTDVPVTTVPQTDATNTHSLFPGGSGTKGVSAASYAGLNLTGSATVEFWVKTPEGLATLVSHSGDSSSGNSHNAATKGFTIYMESGTLYAKYRLADGQVTLSVASVDFSDWTFVAWTYDQGSGVGKLYLNGVEQTSNDGLDGQGLVWNSSNRDLWVGEGLDDANGGIDEVRISDVALSPSQFLNVPEPATLGLLGAGVILMLSCRR